MTAEFDTSPSYDEDPPAPAEEPPADDDRRDRRIWGAVALLALVILLLLALLTQCTTHVPDVVGLDRTRAEARLQNTGLTVGDVSEVPTGQVEPGLVAEQIPVAGSVVRRGGKVDLAVALGNNLVTVPNVVGLDSANAAIQLQQANFNPIPTEEYSEEVTAGVAIRQSPQGGTLAAKGSDVTVYFSLGLQDPNGINVDHTDTNDGLTDAQRDSSGSGSDQYLLHCTKAYPNASVWSSKGDIYVRLTPGGAVHHITSDSQWDTNPIIAPSHKYAVFMRATNSQQRSRTLGVVCFTKLKYIILEMPEVPMRDTPHRWVEKPIFAPSKNSTTANTDWIVFPQFWYDDYIPGSNGKNVASARIIVCNPLMDSKWVSWNEKLRPAGSIKVTKSSKPGCVRIRKYVDGNVVYDRNLQLSTGLYLR